MDGTADAVLMMAMLSGGSSRQPQRQPAGGTKARFIYDQGAITRGDPTTKRLAVVFTGDEFAEGAEVIATTLKARGIHSSFFFTGRFYRNANFKAMIQRLKQDGHYLGAHSDQHLLYCDWEKRDKLLVTREEFTRDLNTNYATMVEDYGLTKGSARYFLPPYEWYNRSISDWTTALDLQLINFTPGTRSNADYTTPAMKNYLSSETILKSIKDYEAKDPAGLNGFILLLHVGVSPERTDKFTNTWANCSIGCRLKLSTGSHRPTTTSDAP